MCELPARSWRALFPLARVIYALMSLTAIVGGVVAGRVYDSPEVAWPLIFLGGALLVMAALLPSITEFEFGIPVALRVVAAVRDREAQLRQTFEDQRAELELCTQLLCRDPAQAAHLLLTAYGRTAREWLRPVGPHVRLYVWCVLLHLITESERLTGPPASQAGPVQASRLDVLDFHARVVVVLNSFAGLTIEEMSALLGRPTEVVQAELLSAESALERTVG